MKIKNLINVNCIAGILFVVLIIGGMIVNRTLQQNLTFYAQNNSLADLVSQEESMLADNFINKDRMISINGLFCRILGQRYMNGIYLLDNGHGASVLENCSDYILENNAEKIKQLSDYCNENGHTFTYVQVPFKIAEDNTQLPVGVQDFSNDIEKRFGEFCLSKGVDYLSLRQSMNDDFYSYYYRTEHHWNSYGGFNAFCEIATYMEKNYGDEIEQKVLDINNYECEVYEGIHSGYYGSRVGKFFIKPEDFYLLYPSYYTDQVCEIPHRELIRKGSFYDAVLEHSFLDDETIHGMYETYIGGDYPLVIHNSNTASTDKSILLFIDSFGTIPEAFLTTAYKEVIAVDLRWVLRNGWNETAKDYIDEYNPDHVVVMFNPNQIISEKSEQFDYGLE